MRSVKLKRLIGSVLKLYSEHRLSIASAGLCYFLTLSFFPLLICLQFMLGSMVPATEELRSFLSVVFPENTVSAILDYLRYVADNRSDTMLFLALTVVVSSSAAAFRVMDRVMGAMRGGRRFFGAGELGFSFCFSLLFLVTICFAVILIGTGKWFLEFADRHIYFMNISASWRWWRFVLLFLLLFVMISAVYRITAPPGKAKRHLPGALLSSAALVVISVLFSAFIGASVKYSLLYGSLASVIVIMLWLYTAGNILFLGAALNVTLERTKEKNGAVPG